MVRDLIGRAPFPDIILLYLTSCGPGYLCSADRRSLAAEAIASAFSVRSRIDSLRQ